MSHTTRLSYEIHVGTHRIKHGDFYTSLPAGLQLRGMKLMELLENTVQSALPGRAVEMQYADPFTDRATMSGQGWSAELRPYKTEEGRR